MLCASTISTTSRGYAVVSAAQSRKVLRKLCTEISVRPSEANTRRSAIWLNGRYGAKIGIGGRLATPPLPHHRAYGSVPRRFDRVRLGRAHRFGEDRATRNSRCVGLVGPPDVRTCARAQSVNQLRPLRQTLLRRDGVTPRSGFAWFAIAAKDTNAIFDGSTLRSS